MRPAHGVARVTGEAVTMSQEGLLRNHADVGAATGTLIRRGESRRARADGLYASTGKHREDVRVARVEGDIGNPRESDV